VAEKAYQKAIDTLRETISGPENRRHAAHETNR
jgi:hypothetical protein